MPLRAAATGPARPRANLSASGVIHGGDDSAQAMADPLTRADVAELLDGAMDVMADQDGSIWFSWS